MFKIEYYPAKYSFFWESIFCKGFLGKYIGTFDWLILEEPQHLLGFVLFRSLKKKALKVSGIIHTNNYFYYTQKLPSFLADILFWKDCTVIKKNTHDFLYLSSYYPQIKGALVCNVHGVLPVLFDLQKPTLNKAYFIGKLIWEKGFEELMENLDYSDVRQIDIFGSGELRNEISAAFIQKEIKADFKGPVFHPKELKDHKIFINCSRSEVLCSTTAEAIAMGKFVLIPKHQSNEFFYQFKNCLVYDSKESFKSNLQYALNEEPDQQSSNLKALSWEAATDHLLKNFCIKKIGNEYGICNDPDRTDNRSH